MVGRAAAFDWNRAHAFLATAEHGSLSAAARVLGLTQPTLGRQVTALEQELGVVLFDRVGRQLVLTEAGQDLLEHVRAMHEAAARFSLVAAGQSQQLSGLVRISASEAMSAFVLPSIVQSLRERHPGVQVEVVVSNTASDLRRREADIAVRHTRPKGDDLVARLIRERSCAYLYGTPEYLARIGEPTSPEALARSAHVIGFDQSPNLLKALNGAGLPFAAESFPVFTDNHLVQWEMAKQGLGLCMMMSEVGDHEPRVRRALPHSHDCGFPFPTWLTCHRELRTSRRLRVVFDHLMAGLSDWGSEVSA